MSKTGRKRTYDRFTGCLLYTSLGEYQLSADYSGILSEFNRPVTAHFESEDSIRVYGLQGMKLTAHVANKLKDGSFYYDVDLENNANVERYLPRVNTTGILNSVI